MEKICTAVSGGHGAAEGNSGLSGVLLGVRRIFSAAQSKPRLELLAACVPDAWAGTIHDLQTCVRAPHSMACLAAVHGLGGVCVLPKNCAAVAVLLYMIFLNWRAHLQCQSTAPCGRSCPPHFSR